MTLDQSPKALNLNLEKPENLYNNVYNTETSRNQKSEVKLVKVQINPKLANDFKVNILLSLILLGISQKAGLLKLTDN